MKFFNPDSLIATIMVFILMALFPILFSFQIFKPFQQTLEDFSVTDIVFSKIRHPADVTADTNIVIVNTEKMNSTQIARTALMLSFHDPAVIAVGSVLDKAERPVRQEMTANIFAGIDNLVFAAQMTHFNEESHAYDSLASSPEDFIGQSAQGYTNIFINESPAYNTARTFPPLFEAGGRRMRSFAVEAASLYDPELTDRFLQRDMDMETINYRGNFQKFMILNGVDILNSEIEPSFVHGKIIVMGVVKTFDPSRRFDRMYFTPLNERYAGRTFPDMYGAVVQANIISMILEQNFFQHMPLWLSVLISICFCYFNTVIFAYICKRNKKWYEVISLLIFVVESILILIATVYIFYIYNYELKLTLSLYAVAVSVLIFEVYNDSVKPLLVKAYHTFKGR
jgi:hypothetical protein